MGNRLTCVLMNMKTFQLEKNLCILIQALMTQDTGRLQ